MCITSYSRFEKGDNWLRVYSETAYSYVSAGKYVDYNKMKVGKTYTFSAYVTVTKGVGALSLRDKNAKILFSTGNINSSGWYEFTFVLPYSEEAYFSFFATMGTAEIGDVTYSNIQVEEGNSRTEYEPYKEIVSTIPTPNGFAGIPTDSGGNYTDADGQQGICDEIVKYADGTGERMQRIKKVVYDGVNLKFTAKSSSITNNIFYADMKTKDFKSPVANSVLANIMSSHFTRVTGNNGYGGSEPCVYGSKGYSNIYFGFGGDSEITTVDSANAWLQENNIIVYYELAEPISTPLTAEEIAEIEKLHTFYPVTNISNDSDCGMKVKYLADSKNYVDNQLALQAQSQEAAMINMLLLLPEETQAAMIENDTNNLLTESEE